MKLLNPNGWSCGPLSCTSGANAAADITTPPVPDPAPQQMSTAAKAVKRRGNSRPKWIGGLTIPKEKDVPTLGLVGPRQLGRYDLRQPLVVDLTRMTSEVFVAALRIANILENIGEDLKNDITKVLAVYDDKQSDSKQLKAANREFLGLYAQLLKTNSDATFEKPAFRRLMRGVANKIDKLAEGNAPSTSHPPVSIASTSLVVPPRRRLDFVATNMAFQIISAASAQNLLAAQPTARVTSPSPVQVKSTPAPVGDLVESVPAPLESVQKSGLRRNAERAVELTIKSVAALSKVQKLKLSNLGDLLASDVSPHKPAVQTPSNLAASAQSPDEQRRRAEEANRQAVSDMRRGNVLFTTWLDRNKIAVASNSGIGLNCLAISLQQHATGEYGTDYESLFSTQANVMRQELGIAPGMLYSDDIPASQIIGWINRNYGTNMVLVEVQANEQGEPVITTPPEQIPGEGDKVVIWQQGMHFEALYAKTSQPASS